MQYHYLFWGKVIQGHKRGKTLGFPTANIRLHRRIPEGIYISKTSLRTPLSRVKQSRLDRHALRDRDDGEKNDFFSVTFIGAAKTFGEGDYKVETYILDFNQEIYNTWITIQLIKKIRENKKFESEKELVKQMEEDIKQTEKFFQTH